MKTTQFRALVKEIIKEVISETTDDTPDDRDAPVDLTGMDKPTSKTDKKWRGKMRTLDKIKAEPDFKDKLKAVQQRKGDEPLTHKTSYSGGSV
jgi:hypothetical protein